jgi:hypothetical protein
MQGNGWRMTDDISTELAQRLVHYVDGDLLAWCERHHLTRTAVLGDAAGEVIEAVAPPVLLLGPASDEVRALPNPDVLGYPEKRLAAMSLDDFHIFLLRWLTRAVDAGLCRCMVCRRTVRNDLPDEPWDGIFVDKELVCWLIIHFDCKRGLAREFKGRHPFELAPLPPEPFDVSHD